MPWKAKMIFRLTIITLIFLSASAWCQAAALPGAAGSTAKYDTGSSALRLTRKMISNTRWISWSCNDEANTLRYYRSFYFSSDSLFSIYMPEGDCTDSGKYIVCDNTLILYFAEHQDFQQTIIAKYQLFKSGLRCITMNVTSPEPYAGNDNAPADYWSQDTSEKFQSQHYSIDCNGLK
jgi:hypothetical protein